MEKLTPIWGGPVKNVTYASANTNFMWSVSTVGHTNRGNGAYAILQLLENGDLLFNSVIGPYRIPLMK